MKKILFGIVCSSLFILGTGDIFAVEGAKSLSTDTSKAESSSTKTDAEIAADKAEKEATRQKRLKQMKELAEQSSTFNVGKFLQVGNEANLTINAKDEENNLIYRIINMMISIMGIVAILLYVVAGFFIITAGDENQLQKGKTILIYTSLGIVVAFSSYILVQIILSAIFTVA